MIELLLNPNFPNQCLLYLAARQRSFLNLLYCNHDSGSLMLCELHFTIRALTKVGITRRREFEVFFSDVLENALELSLFCCQSALIIAIFNKWCVCFDSLALR